jgi:hypothetical protein
MTRITGEGDIVRAGVDRSRTTWLAPLLGLALLMLLPGCRVDPADSDPPPPDPDRTGHVGVAVQLAPLSGTGVERVVVTGVGPGGATASLELSISEQVATGTMENLLVGEWSFEVVAIGAHGEVFAGEGTCEVVEERQAELSVDLVQVGDRVATPNLSPPGGRYIDHADVSIGCATEGARIHYTLDGSFPTRESSLYGSPLQIRESTIVRALAVRAGWVDSEIATATYVITGVDDG